jgi:glutamate formiminotransferase/formiminotetrahydrofolate cyclodeaminase
MAQIVECVPNFSEGRDSAVIKQITDAIESVDGAELKDVDPGPDMNRVVVTILGPPAAVQEAAFRAIRTAAEVIDMSKHQGTHPRMGATDVCPFVPVNEVSMQDCVQLARELGRRVGEELGIPVYLYEEAARSEERRNLAVVRRGEYEALPEKLQDPHWKPDFGPATFNARAGATAIGAREFLIAYNISLNSRNKDHATDIAFELRQKGRSARRGNTTPHYYKGEILRHGEGRFPCGSCEFQAGNRDAFLKHTQDAHGYDYLELLALHGGDPALPPRQSVKKPGLFSHCKAIGWVVPEYDRVQLSINLTNYKVTPPHLVLEKARELAAERGLVVTGSEIVGLVPLEAMLQAGRYYLSRQGRSTGIPTRDILNTAVQSMGLRDVAPFDIKEKVIGFREPTADTLVRMHGDAFVHEVSRDSPAPGGGSVAAMAGSLGAALASMVANLTYGKPGFEPVEPQVLAAAEKAQRAKDRLLDAVDADTRAFNAYMDALRLPQGSPAEKQARQAAMQDGLKQAIAVPLETARLSLEAIEAAEVVAVNGNPSSVSDAGVGAQMAYAGVQGGALNVLINLGGIEDQAFVDDMKRTCNELDIKARELLERTMKVVRDKVGAG